jgi:hypothetical protein
VQLTQGWLNTELNPGPTVGSVRPRRDTQRLCSTFSHIELNFFTCTITPHHHYLYTTHPQPLQEHLSLSVLTQELLCTEHQCSFAQSHTSIVAVLIDPITFSEASLTRRLYIGHFMLKQQTQAYLYKRVCISNWTWVAATTSPFTAQHIDRLMTCSTRADLLTKTYNIQQLRIKHAKAFLRTRTHLGQAPCLEPNHSTHGGWQAACRLRAVAKPETHTLTNSTSPD